MRPTTLGVIGLGAIGGSVARQAKQAGIGAVLGWSPDAAERAAALRLGALAMRRPSRPTSRAGPSCSSSPPRPPPISSCSTRCTPTSPHVPSSRMSAQSNARSWHAPRRWGAPRSSPAVTRSPARTRMASMLPGRVCSRALWCM
ncbi:MAG: hypothetical protein DMD49_03845 [Gemmatimonadetes bacterium]|nr:MAG: hypothetical protein DMD49_03845 [Gemmatimonadota bacterium]